MAYAKASLIQDIRHLLEDNPWETTSTTTDTGTTVAVPDGTKWAVGDIGEWQTGTVGGEQFLVKSIATNDLTVARGYNGTTAEAHSSGDRVVKNARYSYIQIVEAISKTINAFGESLWTTADTTITPSSSTIVDSELTGTNLSGMLGLVHGVQVVNSANKLGYYGPAYPGVPRARIKVYRNVPTATYTSGIAVRFPDGYLHDTNDVTLRWRVKITDTVSGSNYSDLEEGLLSDVVVYGVVSRLLGGKEIPLLSEQQKTGSIGVGSFTGIANNFELIFREKMSAYQKELQREAPKLPDQDWIPGWW